MTDSIHCDWGGGGVVTSPRVLALFAFSFTLSIGVLWEILEYALDNIFGWNMQKSSLPGTMWDLMLDSIGALLATVIGSYYLKVRKKKGLLSDIDEAVNENA